MCVGVQMPRSEDNFEDTISCFHLYVGPRYQTQVIRSTYVASVLPSDHFASPYLATFLMYCLQVKLLNFLKQYKLLSCMKTKAWECSVYNTVHIIESSSWDAARGAMGGESRGDKPTALRGLCGSIWLLDR